jgi:6-phosphogluconolactonase
MQFHPNGKWAYFVNEQGKSVTLCDYDSAQGTMKIRQTVSTVPPGWDITQGSCADIHVSADGRFVYASNRGHDSLAVFSVDAASGELKSHGQTPTEKTPRSFCLVPGGEKFVVSAGQGSGRLIVYRRDTTTGALTPLKTYDCGKDPGWVLALDLTPPSIR